MKRAKVLENEPKYIDYAGFTYDGIHSSQLGLYKVTSGNRYDQDLSPAFSDKTVQAAGSDGTLIFGTDITKRDFTINIAYDSITEGQFHFMERLFSNKKLVRLIFDETPYKEYWVKSSSAPQLKYVCFDEGLYKERIYKGEGTLKLVCYEGFARGNIKSIEDLDSFVNAKKFDLYIGPNSSFYDDRFSRVPRTEESNEEDNYELDWYYNIPRLQDQPHMNLTDSTANSDLYNRNDEPVYDVDGNEIKPQINPTNGYNAIVETDSTEYWNGYENGAISDAMGWKEFLTEGLQNFTSEYYQNLIDGWKIENNTTVYKAGEEMINFYPSLSRGIKYYSSKRNSNWENFFKDRSKKIFREEYNERLTTAENILELQNYSLKYGTLYIIDDFGSIYFNKNIFSYTDLEDYKNQLSDILKKIFSLTQEQVDDLMSYVESTQDDKLYIDYENQNLNSEYYQEGDYTRDNIIINFANYVPPKVETNKNNSGSINEVDPSNYHNSAGHNESYTSNLDVLENREEVCTFFDESSGVYYIFANYLVDDLININSKTGEISSYGNLGETTFKIVKQFEKWKKNENENDQAFITRLMESNDLSFWMVKNEDGSINYSEMAKNIINDPSAGVISTLNEPYTFSVHVTRDLPTGYKKDGNGEYIYQNGRKVSEGFIRKQYNEPYHNFYEWAEFIDLPEKSPKFTFDEEKNACVANIENIGHFLTPINFYCSKNLLNQSYVIFETDDDQKLKIDLSIDSEGQQLKTDNSDWGLFVNSELRVIQKYTVENQKKTIQEYPVYNKYITEGDFLFLDQNEEELEIECNASEATAPTIDFQYRFV